MSYQYSQNLVQSTNVPPGSIQYSQNNVQTVGRTLIDSSSPEHPIQLASSNQVVSQILTTTQGSPTRQSKTFVYRSESPIRSSQYGKHVVNVSHIEKGQAPIYVSQSTVQNPIYVEKIVKVESSNTSELNLLRQRISALELQNKTLTEELITLRNNTPQEVEQIVYIENNEEINKLRFELNNIKALSDAENENVKRSKKNLEDQFNLVLQERDRMIIQLKELTVKITEFQSLIASRDVQINNLKIQNENLATRLVLTTAELEKVTQVKVESEPLKRKVNELEQYLVQQERIIEDLRLKLGQQEQVISQLRMFEIRCAQYESEINALRAKLQESENNSLLLIKKIEELQNLLNDENVKRSKKDGELAISLRDKQALEEKLVHLTQQVEFLTRKVAAQEQDINAQRTRIIELEGVAAKVGSYEQQIQYLSQQIERLNQVIREKDQTITQLNIELNQLRLSNSQIAQLQEQIVTLQQNLVTRTAEVESLRKRVSEQELLINQLRMYEQRVNEYEQIINALRQRIAELEAQLNDENIKRSKRDGDLAISLRDKQALEEKLVHMTQQIEFLSQKVNQLTGQVAERDQIISQLRVFEIRVKEYENVINALRQRVAELEAQLNDENVKRSKKDGELAISLRDKQALEEKLVHMTQQIEFLSQKVAQYEKILAEQQQQLAERDNIINQLRVFEIRVKEYENVINALRQRVAELEAQLNDENVKRSKKDGELAISLRDKQALEEKLVHMTQQIEFLSQKVAQYEKILAEQQQQLAERDNIINQLRVFEIRVKEYENVINALRQRVAELEAQLNDENVKRSKKDGELAISLRDKQALEEKLVHMTQQIEFLSQKVNQLTGQVAERDQIISQLRVFEIRVKEYENVINALRQRVAELEAQLNDENVKRSKKDGELAISLRDKQALEEKLVHMTQQIEFLNMKVTSYEKQIQEKDGQINQLRIEISQLQINLQQLQNASEEVRRLTELLVVKTTEIDQLRKRLAELEIALQEFNLVQAKLQECEKNNQLLRQRIAELEALLNDEAVKRSRNQGDLEISLRDKQALEEKLVHMTQQIEFLSRKVTQLTEENNNLKVIVSSYQQIIDEWQSITVRHASFSQLLENLKVRVQQISYTSSSSVISQSSYVRSSGVAHK
ncbi:hypothetical protein ABPG74_020934 [Tetrahymena malaccensis]